jgi:hypothetical protein
MIKKNLSLSSLVKAIVLAGIIITTTLPAMANKKAISNTPAPVVEYISSDETGTILSVEYKNELKQKFTILIRDEAGNTVYRKEYDGENFSKTFQLVSDNGENNTNLTMMVMVNGGNNYSFNINTSFDVITKVEVTKL